MDKENFTLNIKKMTIPNKRRILIFLLILFVIQLYMKPFLPFNFWLLDFQSSIITLSNGRQEVILVGMSHMGESSYYKELKRRFKFKKHIVLSEGVNFNNEEVTNIHSGKAFRLGLKTQEEFNIFNQERSMNSDINIEEMDKDVSDFLSLLFDSDQYEFKEHEIYNSFSFLKKLYSEVILKRNDKVISNILKNSDENIIVPWGAIHLIDLEKRLKNNGFKIVKKEHINVFSLPKVTYNFFSNYWSSYEKN